MHANLDATVIMVCILQHDLLPLPFALFLFSCLPGQSTAGSFEIVRWQDILANEVYVEPRRVLDCWARLPDEVVAVFELVPHRLIRRYGSEKASGLDLIDSPTRQLLQQRC